MNYTTEITATLDKLNQMGQEMNALLQGLIDKLNAGDKSESQPMKEQKQKSAPVAELSEHAITVLKECAIDGTTVKLPNRQLDRKLYLEVKDRLELIGGKWKGGKVQGFVFLQDPSELMAQIANGEKRNLKKEYQFFGTPAPLAYRLVKLAEIKQKHKVLEPSAGQGAIINAIMKLFPAMWVDACELMEVNQTILEKNPNAHFVCADFLKIPDQYIGYYDRIIANPPFAKNQDILHIRKMYDCLKKGGRLVSVASKHWQFASGKKETAFKNWLKEVDAEVQEIERGAFSESGTEVAGVIIIIDKK